MELSFIYTMQQKNIKYKGYIIFVLNCSQSNSNLFLVQTKHILRTTIPNSSLSHSPKYHKEWKDFRLSLLFLYYFFHLSRFILSNYFFIISGKIVSTHFIFKKCIKNCHSELQFEKRNTYMNSKYHELLANNYFRHFSKVRINIFTHCAPVKMSLKQPADISCFYYLLSTWLLSNCFTVRHLDFPEIKW